MAMGWGEFMKKQPRQQDIEIGDRIRRLRNEILKISTQAEFAKPLGVTRGAVANWEVGKGIKRDNLQRMANHYRVSLDWLATGRGNPDVELFLPDRLRQAMEQLEPDEIAEAWAHLEAVVAVIKWRSSRQ